MKLQNFLEKQGVCKEALKWVGNKSPQEAYAQCENGEWLLWLHNKLRLDEDALRKRVLVAGLTVNLVKNLMKYEESKAAVDAAIAFGKGEIGIDSLNHFLEDAKVAYRKCYNEKKVAYAAETPKAAEAAYIAACAAASAVDCIDVSADTEFASVSAVVLAAKAAKAAYADDINAKSADIFRDHISFEELSILL